jgi:hypothetical protein
LSSAWRTWRIDSPRRLANASGAHRTGIGGLPLLWVLLQMLELTQCRGYSIVGT